jgi:shikimate dehydrogenase
MEDLLGLNKIDDKTKVIGIIGKPIEHSLSPIMHNSAFKELDLNYIYLKFNVDKSQLALAIEAVRALGVRGLNVTMPYKNEVMQYLDKLDALAEEIGAVNTIVNNAGVLTGYNTDAYGALEALKNNEVDLNSIDGKVLIIGAGGGARAVAYGLAKIGAEIVIANRTFKKGEQLAKELNKITSAKAITIKEIPMVIHDTVIMINCTPTGMTGSLSMSLIPGELIKKDMIVFDIVSKPKETPLIKLAKEKGAKVIFGYEMVVYQGAKAFELWTGKIPPLDVMRKVVLDELDKE